MGKWIDDVPVPKTPQTWKGLLVGNVEDEDALREVVEANGSDFLAVTVTRRTDDEFFAFVTYGPVKGANKTDIIRVLKKTDKFFSLQHIETIKE